MAIRGYTSSLVVAVSLGESTPENYFYTMSEGPLRCKQGHEPEHNGQKFCSFDGHAFEKTTVVTPKELLVHQAALVGMTPDALYDQFWGRKARVRFFCLDVLRADDSLGAGGCGLGMKLQEFPFLTHRAHDEVGTNINEIVKAKAEVEEAAKKLGIPGEAQLYLTARVNLF